MDSKLSTSMQSTSLRSQPVGSLACATDSTWLTLNTDGKLDPVLARNDEIRRCIRILSRRTKVGVLAISQLIGAKSS